MLATQQQAPLNIIEILKSRRFPYQTTTYAAIYMYGVKLYYIVSLHQTTTTMWCMLTARCCIISFLYIKPQPMFLRLMLMTVVLYRFSTSNHNCLSTEYFP